MRQVLYGTNFVVLILFVCSLFSCRSVPGDTRVTIQEASTAVTGSAEAVDSARGDAADIRNQLEADDEREKRREEQSLEDNKYLREQSGSIKSLIDAIEALAREGLGSC